MIRVVQLPVSCHLIPTQIPLRYGLYYDSNGVLQGWHHRVATPAVIDENGHI